MSNKHKEQQELEIRDCGVMAYGKTLHLQRELVRQRIDERIADTILLVEHEPVITLGIRKTENKLLSTKDDLKEKGIELHSVKRGGGTTAHNPGQIVIYPILNIKTIGLGVGDYVRRLEAIGIELLGELGVKSERKKGLPGLWVGEKKIASIGVKIRKYVSFHGMAININNDLGIFENIVPCGLDGVVITNVLKETGNDVSIDEIKAKLTKLCREHLLKK
ncbi:MAG: lipoyl(octanoyl) transferase LipB [Planctomycetes bacterium]|nr:lipoyl(octanoyl) transferase LipB [Planctomycetota bacterium]